MNDTGRHHTERIIAALAVALTGHVPGLPSWIVCWCLVMWGYAIISRRRRRVVGTSYAIPLLVAGGILGVVSSYGHMTGKDTGIALLAVMAGLKPLEMRTHRDRVVTLFMAYFLVITAVLESNSLIMAAYMFMSVVVITAMLAGLNSPGENPGTHLSRSALITLQALPLMLIFFFLFPRIQGTLWGTNIRTLSATGFAERLSPGSVSRLARNSDTAFRARFEGPMPDRNLLYWRGITFLHFDGDTWHPGMTTPRSPEPFTGAHTFRYAVTLEPHHGTRLFALDLPVTARDQVRLHQDYTLRVEQPVMKKITYRVVSSTGHGADRDGFTGRGELHLPPYGNPRARALALGWAREHDPRAIVERALDHITDNGFSYTLSPPPLRGDSVDSFLFDTKRGFCEHYASAFAFLMRAAGVPARIVGGYLGGEVNPFGGYLIVRQSDAHAWVEVWLSGRGWVRVDPTAAVAPERVLRGMAWALDPDELEHIGSQALTGPIFTAWNYVRFGWDAINTGWYMWVSDYSFSKQERLFRKLGIRLDSWKGVFAAVAAVAALAGLFLLLYLWGENRTAGPIVDQAMAAYARFCRRCGAIGLPRRPWQGPGDFAETVGSARPDLKEAVDEITRLYILARYSGRGEKTHLHLLKDRIARFAPRR